MELRRYQRRFFWMWDQVKQDFCLLVEKLIPRRYREGLWSPTAVQSKVVSSENLFWANCVRAQIDLVTAVPGTFGHDELYFLFLVISRHFLIIVRNLDYAVKFWGQTSTLRFVQVCTGKLISVRDSCVCCPQVTVAGTDWWHWRRGIWWIGRAYGRRRSLSSWYWMKMVTRAAVCTDDDGECIVAELLHAALRLANLLVIPYTWPSCALGLGV